MPGIIHDLSCVFENLGGLTGTGVARQTGGQI